MNVRRMLRWLGRTLPRDWMVVLALACYVTIEVVALWFVPPGAREREYVLRIRDGFLLAVAAGYGYARVLTFHPVFHAEYREWLARTPWSRGKPLPVGPVHLVWQDAMVVGLLCLAQHDAIAHRALVPTFFFVGYHLGAVHACGMVGAKNWAYGLAYATAAVVLLMQFPLAALAGGAALSLAALAGLRATLASFPWDAADGILERWKRFSQRRQDSKDRQSASWTAKMLVRDGLDERLGWPFGIIDTHDPGIQVSRLDGFLLSLLVGWWLFALMAVLPARISEPLACFLLVYVIIVGVCGRLAAYCSHYRPPISLVGRIATGRWIIPKYDRVWIGPLAALAAGAAIPAGGFYAGLPPGFFMPAAYVVTLSLLINAEPSLRAWRTTGEHRIVPGMLDKRKFLEH